VSTDSFAAPARLARRRARPLPRALARLMAYPELLGLLAATGVLNLWNLSINGFANTYYAAAVKSMSTNWHDFLFASMDKSGLMTVDKPPLALWVEALSARVFGFSSWSILVPQALMGIAAAGLMYDMVRRRFGRFAGFVAGLTLATTPIIVAVSRHNNPDELLILCTVAAFWFALRAFDTGRTKWLVWCGVFIGLGFETKMLAALIVLPAIALAYFWVAPRGRMRAVRQLFAAGGVMAVVALAWPLLVTLTPAADRPWISGTADNSIWSLIFGYNGLGRVAGQAGGPSALGGGGGAGGVFGGPTGLFRLLESGLGDQAGWLLGFALVAAAALVVVSRLRRSDARTGYAIAFGGALLTAALVFSFASGIFHPYYVSYLAPMIAALVGAGAGIMLGSGRTARIVAPALIAGGAVTELVVLGELGGQLTWAVPLLVAVGGASAVLLATALPARLRRVAVGVALAALLAAPATWAAETLGHATSGTFPTGGPASAGTFGGGPGGGGGFGGGHRFRGGFGGPGGFAPPTGGGTAQAGPGVGRSSGTITGNLPSPGGAGGFAGGGGGFAGAGGAAGGFAGGGGAGGGFGGQGVSTAVIKYVNAHGGGTIGVESQSSAATSILSDNANVAGLGGFSGRESSVTAKWIAMEVKEGRLRWIIGGGSGGFGAPGDTRTGSEAAFAVVEKACPSVTVDGTKLYDCAGRASAIVKAAQVSAAKAES
jgi:4-amino-4-deoxy-L-arabinose transferase-like glycosyltransferase